MNLMGYGSSDLVSGEAEIGLLARLARSGLFLPENVNRGDVGHCILLFAAPSNKILRHRVASAQYRRTNPRIVSYNHSTLEVFRALLGSTLENFRGH